MLGYLLPDATVILMTGLFALSGGITNWLAVHMLFERIPFLYGSGVIPARFVEFKSGIKTLIVKQYLPIINQLVNQYLAKLDFFVKFHLDENFDERILSRHRDDFSYASFSEGEKSRIDLALLLTWRAVARMMNSCTTNLVILDEVFDSSLDDGGLAEVTKILYNLGEDQNVMVISHKGDQIADKFKSTLRFEKVRGFSKIA